MRFRKLPWLFFGAALLLAASYVLHTSPDLPLSVASHFNADGIPNAFMSRDRYVNVILGMSVGFPLLLVGILTLVSSYATHIKVPNRDYWLSPERIAGTRAMLIARAAWFGCMLCLLMCFVHYLELNANAQVPPHLSGTLAIIALLTFLTVTSAWMFVLLRAFRKP